MPIWNDVPSPFFLFSRMLDTGQNSRVENLILILMTEAGISFHSRNHSLEYEVASQSVMGMRVMVASGCLQAEEKGLLGTNP